MSELAIEDVFNFPAYYSDYPRQNGDADVSISSDIDSNGRQDLMLDPYIWPPINIAHGNEHAAENPTFLVPEYSVQSVLQDLQEPTNKGPVDCVESGPVPEQLSETTVGAVAYPSLPEGSTFSDGTDGDLLDQDADGELDEEYLNEKYGLRVVIPNNTTADDTPLYLLSHPSHARVVDDMASSYEAPYTLHVAADVDATSASGHGHYGDVDAGTQLGDAIVDVSDNEDGEDDVSCEETRDEEQTIEDHVHPLDDPSWTGACLWVGCAQYGVSCGAKELQEHLLKNHVTELNKSGHCSWTGCHENLFNGRRHLLDRHCRLLQVQCSLCGKFIRKDMLNIRHGDGICSKGNSQGATASSPEEEYPGAHEAAMPTRTRRTRSNAARPTAARTYAEDNEDPPAAKTLRRKKRARSSTVDDDEYRPSKRRRA